MFTVLVAGDDGEERVAGEGVLFGAEWGVESREGVSLLPSADRRPQTPDAETTAGGDWFVCQVAGM